MRSNLHITYINAGRRICKFYVDAARQVSGDDGAYDGVCCGLPTTALLTSRRPPGEVSLPFPAQIGASAGCRLVPAGVPYRKCSTCNCRVLSFVGLGCSMLSRHPILSLGTLSRPLGCHDRSYKVRDTQKYPNVPMCNLFLRRRQRKTVSILPRLIVRGALQR